MRPIIIMTVGYITGIIWGLYLKINIVPIILLIIFVGLVIKALLTIKGKTFEWVSEHLGSFVIKKRKKQIIFFLIFLIISNIQINYLENKFKNLYQRINNVEIIRKLN